METQEPAQATKRVQDQPGLHKILLKAHTQINKQENETKDP